MTLSKKQVENICLVNGGHQRCRYLGQDDLDWSKYNCLKLSGKKKDIDSQVDEYMLDANSKKQDPFKSNAPFGDNCSGYPVLRFIEQGYDKKN